MMHNHFRGRIVPTAKQRYDTVGDWKWDSKSKALHVFVSECNSDSEFLVGIHELIEAYLYTRKVGDPETATQTVDEFDLNWCAVGYDEPGDDPNAPYHKEHRIATIIERMLAHEMGYSWERHEKVLEDIGKEVKP